jgi:hypothetical protein
MWTLESVANITAPETLSRLKNGDQFTPQFYRLAADQSLPAIVELVKVLQDGSTDSLWISGGKSAGLDIAELSRQLNLPSFLSPDGNFGGESGGLKRLEDKGIPAGRGMVVDFGQTCLKVSWAGRRWLIPRDLEILPRETGRETFEEAEAAADRLADFLCESIQKATREANAGPPDGVIWALAGVLSREAIPLQSSYIGLSGNPFLIPDALASAGMEFAPYWILPDTTLAALSAREDPRLRKGNFRKTLVLTLGTSIGMASATFS